MGDLKLVKLACAEMQCSGRLKRGKERYIMCATYDMIDDMINNASMWCDLPKNRIKDIDIVEFMTPKGKIIQNKRSNNEDILDIEIVE